MSAPAWVTLSQSRPLSVPGCLTVKCRGTNWNLGALSVLALTSSGLQKHVSHTPRPGARLPRTRPDSLPGSSLLAQRAPSPARLLPSVPESGRASSVPSAAQGPSASTLPGPVPREFHQAMPTGGGGGRRRVGESSPLGRGPAAAFPATQGHLLQEVTVTAPGEHTLNTACVRGQGSCFSGCLCCEFRGSWTPV